MLAAIVAFSLVLSSPTDPFGPRRVPGYPETVDLNDETTWSDLTVSEKDELRAIRQREKVLAVNPPASERAPEPRAAEPPPPRAEQRSLRAASSYDAVDSPLSDYWDERDRTLVIATASFGAVWGVSLATTLGLSFGVQEKAERCADTIYTTSSTSCADSTIRSGKSLMPVAYTMAGVSIITGIGALVSGGMLAEHRRVRGIFGSRSIGLAGRF